MSDHYRKTTWVNERLFVADSSIGGSGLFARAPIEPGETISIWGGSIVSDDELRKLEHHISAAVDEGLNMLIDPESIIRFGNHSCDPNVWMADDVTTVARRRIKAGQEVTIDYATHSVMPEWRMECRCGSANCRRVISGNDWLRGDLQQRYGGHWSPFIVLRIERQRHRADTG